VVYPSITKYGSAHEDAYFNANILHQDISVKNIVVVGDGHGLLSQTQEHHDAAQYRANEYHYHYT
jgi:hypothetical protein